MKEQGFNWGLFYAMAVCVAFWIVVIMLLAGCSNRVLATTDGRTIWVDTEAAEARGLNPNDLVRHEDGHRIGYDHCLDTKCLMYYKAVGNTELCGNCRLDTMVWVKKTWGL